MALKEGFELTNSPDAGDFCELGRRRMYRVWTPRLPGVWTPQVHSSCAHNLVNGLLMRTMGQVECTMTPEGKGMFVSAARLLRRVVGARTDSVVPWTLDEVVSSYSEARMRVRYEAARESLLQDGYCSRRDAQVKAFVKGEKLARYKIHKPRVIMGRTPRYNLELASYLKPVERELYGGVRGFGSAFFTRTRLVAKGLNPRQRAELIRRKMTSEPDIVAVEIDGVSFESHFSDEVLKQEHLFYTQACRDSRLKELLSWQLDFSGKGEGVRFKVAGVRASGDFNTGMGNTIVMCVLMLAVQRVTRKRFDFLADGDNAVLFVKRSDLELWRGAVATECERMGFRMSLEKPVDFVEGVVFGQSKPLRVATGWTMVRDVMKVLSHGACGYQHYHDMVGGMKVLKSVGYCEAVLNRGVPVLQTYAHALMHATRETVFSKAMPENYEYRAILARGVKWELAARLPITSEARIGFEKSWGITVDRQLAMEAELDRSFKVPKSWSEYDLETTLPDGRDLYGSDSLAPVDW